jgi:hypothetical protein
MATEVQKGRGVLFGIPNNGSAITMEGIATFTLESAKLNRKYKTEMVEDENGFDVASISTNTFDELDITWTPTGATRAAAAATVEMLDPQVTMALSNFAISGINGDWIVVDGQSLDMGGGKPGKSQLKLRKYVDEDQNTLMTTTVTG